MTDQQKMKWYEASIGWGTDKSWFIVDEIQPHTPGWRDRKPTVEVTTVSGEVAGIIVQAVFPHLPTLDEVMAHVLDNTHNDHYPMVKYYVTSRLEGLHWKAADQIERMRKCVPDPSTTGDGGAI